MIGGFVINSMEITFILYLPVVTLKSVRSMHVELGYKAYDFALFTLLFTHIILHVTH